MTTPSIDSLKKEIADCYIKDFQKELGWLKGIVILPIKSGMRDILTGKTELPEKFVEIENFKFWKYIIQFFSTELANKIFDFLKSKRQEIISRQTVSELLKLKNEILGIDDEENNEDKKVEEDEESDEDGKREDDKGGSTDSSDNENEEDKNKGISPGAAGVATSAAGTYATHKLKKWAEGIDIDKVVRNLDDEQIKGTIESAIESMEKQKKALKSRLTPHQLETVEKHIAELKNGLEEMKEGGVSELLSDWYAIRERLPGVLLKNSFDARILNQIDNLSGQLYGKTVEEIKDILKEKGIVSSDESLDLLLDCISKAKSRAQVKQMTKVIRGGNRLSKFAKTFAGAMRLDVAFAGLDVWVYMQSEKEAELISKINKVRGENKHNQALFQLGVGLGSVVAEGLIILGICAGGGSYGGPVGTIVGVAVGAVAVGISEAGDTLYYDVKNFYLQNDEDFLRQNRGKIKQAILQGIHNYKKGDTSINEKFTTWASTHKVWLDAICPAYLLFDKTNEEELNNWLNNKQASLEAACRSMIFLEEIEDGIDELRNNRYLLDYIDSHQSKDDFLKDKDEEYKKYFNEYLEKMKARIDKRMEYINKEFEKDEIIDSIYAGAGAQRLTQMFTESKGYANISDDNKRDNSKSYSDNLQSYKEDLFKDFSSEKVKKLESIRKNNPSLFLDIITTTGLDALIGDDESDENYSENVRLVETYKRYMDMFENLEDRHYLYIDNEYKNGLFIHNLLKADFNLNTVKYPTTDNDDLLECVGVGLERRGITEISDNILQNILYKLAKQLNGYTGMNDMYELMKFYSESEDDVNGIYYSDKRKINDDWAIDAKLAYNIPKEIHEADVDKYVEGFIKGNFYTPIYDSNGNFIRYERKSSIDTDTESIDGELNDELLNVVESVVREELKNHTVENQKKVKNEIESIVKQNSNGKFIELPYYLILEAKKAGLGDLQRQFFRWSNDKIEICYMNNEYNTTAIFDKCDKLYISPAREDFTEDEKAYIDRVDSVCEKLNQLRRVEGWGITQSTRHEDDLDLPIEIERIISDKVLERENFKGTILSYNANTCGTAQVIRKYIEYAEYFESLYRGILFAEAGFSRSNDVDTFDLFQSVMRLGNVNFFTDEGKINIEAIKASGGEGFGLFEDQEFISFYNKLYEGLEFKADEDKAAEKLRYWWKSDDANQKELARRVSYDIITTTFEKCLLQTDGSGKVNNISIGSIKEHRKEHKDEIESAVKEHVSWMKVLSNINVNKSLIHEKEIKKLTEGEKEVTDLTPIIENIIKNEKLPDVDWSYDRGNLQYNAEDSSMNSWGEKTKVEIEELGENRFIFKISNLDIEFTKLEEGIRTANLINWLKVNMRNEQIGENISTRLHPDANLDEYKREGGSLVREIKKTSNDIEILKESTIDSRFPTIKNSEVFLEFINKLLRTISSDNGGFHVDDEREGRE